MRFLTLFLVSCARLHMGKLNFYKLLGLYGNIRIEIRKVETDTSTCIRLFF